MVKLKRNVKSEIGNVKLKENEKCKTQKYSRYGGPGCDGMWAPRIELGSLEPQSKILPLNYAHIRFKILVVDRRSFLGCGGV